MWSYLVVLISIFSFSICWLSTGHCINSTTALFPTSPLSFMLPHSRFLQFQSVQNGLKRRSTKSYSTTAMTANCWVMVCQHLSANVSQPVVPCYSYHPGS
ncbi:unnamed protein product [Amoebophrya sp. A25]|nr:unnamed protein product [Amoebophrya sp. A25]|eukprot:GSA25T00016323001.1